VDNGLPQRRLEPRGGKLYDGMTCLLAETPSPLVPDPAVPPPGTIFFYLITGTTLRRGDPGHLELGRGGAHTDPLLTARPATATST